MSDVLDDLDKLGPGAAIKYTSFVICTHGEPNNAEEVARHLIQCVSCREEVGTQLEAERTGLYINKTGWWDANRKHPLHDYD